MKKVENIKEKSSVILCLVYKTFSLWSRKLLKSHKHLSQSKLDSNCTPSTNLIAHWGKLSVSLSLLFLKIWLFSLQLPSTYFFRKVLVWLSFLSSLLLSAHYDLASTPSAEMLFIKVTSDVHIAKFNPHFLVSISCPSQ